MQAKERAAERSICGAFRPGHWNYAHKMAGELSLPYPSPPSYDLAMTEAIGRTRRSQNPSQGLSAAQAEIGVCWGELRK